MEEILTNQLILGKIGYKALCLEQHKQQHLNEMKSHY